MHHRFLSSILSFLLIAAASSVAAENKNLARVSILNYVDETGTQNYAYLPSAFSEAIDQSLQTRFDYVREEPARSEKERLKIKSDGVFDAKDAAEFCRRYESDILIFGRYTFDAKSKQLVVKTYISLGSVEKFRALPERRNATDATIFKVADRVAEDIVREMTGIAKEQKGGKTQPAKQGEKLELKKSAPVAWTGSKWMIGLGGQALLPIGDFATVAKTGGMLNINASRIIFRNFYVGLNGQAAEAKPRADGSNQAATFSFVETNGALGFALFFWGERMRLNTEVGGGMYFAKLQITDSSGGSTTQLLTRSFYNPELRAAISLHFLIFPFLSVGIEVPYTYMFDKGNKAIQHTGLGLQVHYVF